MDHEPSWAAVAAAALEAGVGDEMLLARRLDRYLDAPASHLVDAATAGGFLPGAEEMRARLNSLPLPH